MERAFDHLAVDDLGGEAWLVGRVIIVAITGGRCDRVVIFIGRKGTFIGIFNICRGVVSCFGHFHDIRASDEAFRAGSRDISRLVTAVVLV